MLRSPEEISKEIQSISEKIKELEISREIAEMKAEQHQKAEIARTQECCPDVCKAIDELETQIDRQITKHSFTEKANIKRIQTFPKEFRESLLLKNKKETKKVIEILELRRKELTELKKILSDNNICLCRS